jgi:H+-transporting ATPase
LIVGGLPVAMPAILSLTMAIGASALRKRGAIVTRLTAVEEIAGMEILCCDKTGTLTKNRLAAYNPVAYVGDADDVIFNAALCSIPDNGDAVDAAVIEFCTEAQQEHLQEMQVLDFKPFDPVSKRTQAKLQSPDGEVFYTTKGAPRVILGMCKNKDELIGKVIHDIETLGASGYRTLGVAVGDKTGTKWTMTGLIPLFDPPRKGTKAAIAKAEDDLGVHVKMITGDHLQIAKDTAKLLGMGTNVLPGQSLRYEQKWAEISREAIAELIKSADGFAQVFPEDKYEVVRIHRDEGQYIVGVTGDGGGDAPVLQKANIGIDVYGATDAARAASDIVLTKNGISVIVDAIVEGRQIFQRMKNYCIYSISMNVRTVLTFAILTLAYDFYFPVIAIVLLIFLNDCCVVTICKDRVKSSKTPDKWNLSEIVGTAIAIGIYLTISTVVLFELAVNSDAFHQWFGLPQRSYAEARGLLYLQMSLSGFATQFVTRTHGFSWMIWRERPSIPVIISFVCGQFFASILCAYGLGGFPLDGQFDFRGAGWSFVVVVWIWVIFWYLLMYIIKFLMKAILRGGMVTVHHHKFGSNMHPFHFGQHSTGKGNE